MPSKHDFFKFESGCDYESALKKQGLLASEGYRGLFAFEPKETITFGANSRAIEELIVSDHFLRNRGVEILCTEREGPSLYHGPGQMVGFPLFELGAGKIKNIAEFREQILVCLAHGCAALGIKKVECQASTLEIWTPRGKLVSLGVMEKFGLIFHGFTVNVSQECLSGFQILRSSKTRPSDQITTFENEGIRFDGVGVFAKRLFPYLSVLHQNQNEEAASGHHQFTVEKSMHMRRFGEMALDQVGLIRDLDNLN